MDSRASNKSKPRADYLNTANMKRSSSSNSNSNFDPQQPQPQPQQYQQMESPHSPLRFHSPLRSFSPLNSPENPPVDDSRAVVAVNKLTHQSGAPPPPSSKSAAPGTAMNRVVWEEVPQSARKVEPEGGRAETGVAPVRRRSGKEEKLRIAELCFRIVELSLCLISFSVMAADKTKGWSGDSFDRYKEYKYCLSVNVIGCAYSAFQAYDMGYYMGTGKHAVRHHLRWNVNFFIDQILAYLLISASSSAATRVDDWQSNWGKDEFTQMATASIAISFLAFGAFAVSSIISGYNFCNRESI